MHGCDGLVASRTPDQEGTGCGSRQRRLPTGGIAKGMPLNTTELPCSKPTRAPLARRARGLSGAMDCGLFAAASRIENASPTKDSRTGTLSAETGYRKY